jgi:hypothetical protein
MECGFHLLGEIPLDNVGMRLIRLDGDDKGPEGQQILFCTRAASTSRNC